MTTHRFDADFFTSTDHADPQQTDLQQSIARVAAVPWGTRWLDLLCVLLAGYAVCGRGFAYLGLPPLFVGEAVLLLGLMWLAVSGRWKRVIAARSLWPIYALAAWGLVCTLPYVGVYGTAALRDAALWGYSAYAVIVYGCLLDRPERLRLLWHRYGRLASVFVPVILAIWLLQPRLSPVLPRWPWAENVPIVDLKGGDVLVHLAGVLACIMALPNRTAGAARLMLLIAAVGVIGAHSRAGLLAFAAALGVCAAYRPLNRNLWKMAAVGYLGLLVLAVSGLQLQLSGEGKHREISFRQLQTNVTSIFSETEAGDLDNTKHWRLNWWNKIVGYTVYGPHFWTGKGFGINLADDDGFQGTAWEGRLRSPHNGHLTVLARAGVPGFVVWIFAQAIWCWMIGSRLRHSRRLGRHHWSGLFLFLLAFWTALVVNATFDVFLEGPMGGIWFWTLYGTGLAAVHIYHRSPSLFDPDPSPA